MANEDLPSLNTEAWVEKTNLVQRWRLMKESIEEHKWYESEKAGYDIGWEKASIDWLVKGGPGSKPNPNT